MRWKSEAPGADGAQLQVSGLNVSYGGIQVLNDVTFEIDAGSIVGLIGPNGAGKTTLMNTISGVVGPDRGEIAFMGQPITDLAPHARARLGVARTYQVVRPLRHLSVLENVMVGTLYGKRRVRSTRKARELARTLLVKVGLEDRADVQAEAVSSGQQKLMDLARTLAMEPELLLMDEPLAALTVENQQVVLQVAKQEARAGRAIVLIEHLVGAISEVAERLLVLDRGCLIANGRTAAVLEREDVVDAYLGRANSPPAEASEVQA